jgi:HlyD family secretion protein
MKRRLLIILAVAIAVGAGSWIMFQQIEARRSRSLQIYGNVDIRQVNLGFRVSGRTQEMRLEEGDPVKAGDLIALLDQAPFRDQVNIARAQYEQAQANYEKMLNGFRKEEIDQARAQLAQAKANVANAELTYQRQSSLRQTNVISKQDMDNAIAQRDTTKAQEQAAAANLNLLLAGNRPEDIDAARAQMENAKANLESAERNLSDCSLFAPSDGVIITRAVEPGTIVSAGTTVYALALNEPIWIRTYIDAPDLGRIYPGMRALVYTDTNPDKPYEGQVGFISPIAEFTPKQVQTRELRTDLVFRLRVIISEPDKYLRQGMPVTVKLIEGGRPNETSATRK